MKSPMQYQASECDCAPATFINALKYLLERSNIAPELIKKIYEYTLNRVDCRGTTREATENLVNWLNIYFKENNVKLECTRYTGEIVNTDLIKKELSENTVIILRLWSLYEHYVLVTKKDDNYLYLFDPYYDLKETYKSDSDIEVIYDNNNYNRIVSINRFDLLDIDEDKDYVLGELEKRECIIMRRI